MTNRDRMLLFESSDPVEDEQWYSTHRDYCLFVDRESKHGSRAPSPNSLAKISL